MSSASLPPTRSPAERIGAVGGGIGRNVISELVATFVLMLAGPGVLVLADGVDTLGVALAFGIGVALAIGVLGAVANPVFTLALLLIREIGPRDAVGDWIGQVAGGLAGAGAIWGINEQTRVAVGANGWDRDGLAGVGTVIAAELVFTILLVVVLLSATSRGRSTSAIASFTGAAAALGYLVVLGIDGGGLNPARSLGSAVFAESDPSALAQVWVFVLVPLVAAVMAVFVWLMIDDADLDDTVFDDTFLDDAQNVLTGDPG